MDVRGSENNGPRQRTMVHAGKHRLNMVVGGNTWTLMQCLLNEFLLVGCHILAEGQVE